MQALEQAQRSLQSGRPLDALSICQQVLSQQPDYGPALILAGAAQCALGQFTTAVETLEKASEVTGEDVGAVFYLGHALRGAGRSAEAMECLEGGVKQHPGDVPLLQALAVVQSDVGQHQEAVRTLRRALKRNPGDFRIRFNLAENLRKSGAMDKAAELFGELAREHPGQPMVCNNFGLTLQALGDPVGALEQFRQAATAQPNDPRFLANLGQALVRVHHHGEAARAFQGVVSLQPDNALAWEHLGLAHREAGQIDEAGAAFERAAELAPDRLPPRLHLARLLELTNQVDQALALIDGLPEHWRTDPDIELLKARCHRRSGQIDEGLAVLQRLSSGDLDLDQQIRHHAELGRLLDRADDVEGAWSSFTAMGRLCAKQAVDRGANADHLPQLIAGAESLIRPWTRTADPNTPIFLVGFPRSGTTLLDQFLGGHPALTPLEEKPTLDTVLVAMREWGHEPADLPNLDEATLDRLREVYWDAVRTHLGRDPESRLLDKMPANLAHLPLIQHLWPGTPVIFAARHPFDVCLSNLMQNFRPNTLTVHLCEPESLTRFYNAFVGLGMKVRELNPGTFHEVRYERLVAEPEPELRALFDYLGLEWRDDLLDHTETARKKGLIGTSSYHQVIKPLYQSARYRWVRYQKPAQEMFQTLAPIAEAMGYTTDPDALT